MFVGSVNLRFTNFELVVVPLKGTRLKGQWDVDTDLLLVCHMQSGRFCTCNVDQDPDRFQDKLEMGRADARSFGKVVERRPFEAGNQKDLKSAQRLTPNTLASPPPPFPPWLHGKFISDGDERMWTRCSQRYRRVGTPRGCLRDVKYVYLAEIMGGKCRLPASAARKRPVSGTTVMMTIRYTLTKAGWHLSRLEAVDDWPF